MSRRALPIKMLNKGELDKIAENTEKVKTATITVGKTEAPIKAAPKQDFRKYLNIYNFQCELPGTGETLEFKPLTVGHLKEIQTMDPGPDSDKKENDPIFLAKVFDRIFESVLESDCNLNNMYLNDRFTLILEIRKKTSGETYNWTLMCPKCKGQSVQKIDFESINIKPLPQDIDPVIMLSDQLSVEVDYLTRADEKMAHHYFETKHKNDKEQINNAQRTTEISSLMVAVSIRKIISPDGEYEPSIEDSLYLIENIPQQLYAKIANWQDKYFFGPDMKINIKCPHCKFEAAQEINSSDFFS